MRRILKISLITGIFGLFVFEANFCLALSVPDLIYPEPGETDVSFSPLNFKWEYISGATYYGLHYMKEGDPDWVYIHVDAPPNAKVTYRETGLTPDKNYFWQVQSCDATHCSNWNDPPQSFQTEELAPPPNGNGTNGGGIPIGLINPLQAKTLEEAINAFINFLFYLAMALAPILIIYAAFLLLTAAGDPAKISKARTIILWTLIAVAIILLAKGLPSVIKGAFGG